jgi:hypothetical protein
VFSQDKQIPLVVQAVSGVVNLKTKGKDTTMLPTATKQRTEDRTNYHDSRAGEQKTRRRSRKCQTNFMLAQIKTTKHVRGTGAPYSASTNQATRNPLIHHVSNKKQVRTTSDLGVGLTGDARQFVWCSGMALGSV